MKTILTALALTFALPAFAQTAPAAPADAHPGHHGQHQQGHEGHKEDCCKDKPCCEKMKADGKKMDCCEKKAGEAGTADAHAGHGKH
jgi:hypothetical protein